VVSAKANRWHPAELRRAVPGFFATKMDYVRKIAGRVVGESVDKHGRRAYVMTLRPREQESAAKKPPATSAPIKA